MSDYFDSGIESGGKAWAGGHPQLKAALIFTVPFVIVDFFNYYSAGAALAISCPILFLLYAGCGALSAKFSADNFEVSSQGQLFVGGTAGATLWLISTLINTIVGLVLGTLSLGTTIVLGIPYLCICAPAFLLLGAAASAIGAIAYSSIFKGSPSDAS